MNAINLEEIKGVTATLRVRKPPRFVGRDGWASAPIPLAEIGDILEIESIPGRYIVTDNVPSEDGHVLLRMRPA